jgi:ParB/RepB/Spo0J family partition protein
MSLTYLRHTKLKIHPENIRRFYPEADVAEMAASIKANNGVYQAMLVVAIPDQPGNYHVVDGNMRLAGGRRLGDECPPLKCEILKADEAEQMLIMAITSERHYPKDPISRGLHYRRLRDEELMPVGLIAERTGESPSKIYNVLRLLELDEDIQHLISEGKLSPDPRAARALSRVPDQAKRLELAQRFARNSTSLKSICRQCAFIARQLPALDGAEVPPEPRRRPTLTVVNGNGHHAGGELPRDKIHDIAQKTLCDGCRLDGLGQHCWRCPGPYEFVQHMVELAEAGQLRKAA